MPNQIGRIRQTQPDLTTRGPQDAGANRVGADAAGRTVQPQPSQGRGVFQGMREGMASAARSLGARMARVEWPRLPSIGRARQEQVAPVTAPAVDEQTRERQKMINLVATNIGSTLKAAIADTTRESWNPGMAEQRFAVWERTAAATIRGAGVPPGPRFDQYKADLLMSAFSKLMMDGDVSPHDVGRLFGALPTKTLQSLAPVPNRAMLLDEGASLEGFMVLSGAIGVRLEQLEASFLKASEAVLAQGGPVADDEMHPADLLPREFAAQVVEAARLLDDMTEMTELFRRPQNLETDTRLAELSGQLQALAEESILPINVPELGNAQFAALTRALDRLGVTGIETQVAQRTAERTAAATGHYDSQMTGMVQALASKDPTAILDAGAALAKAFSNLEDLGPPLEAAGRQALVSDALARAARQGGVSPSTLRVAGLGTAGSHLVSMGQTLGARSEQGRQLIAIGQQLQALPAAVAAASHQVGQDHIASLTAGDPALEDLENDLFGEAAPAGAGQPLQSQARPGPAGPSERMPDLPQAWGAAIADRTGVAWGHPGVAMVKSGLANPSLQADLARGMADIQRKPETAHRHAGQETVMAKAMWADLNRAEHRVVESGRRQETMANLLANDDAGGALFSADAPAAADGSTLLFDKQQWALDAPDQRDAHKLSVGARLLAMAGGNRDVVFMASQFAQQQGLYPMQDALRTVNSPIRLPDGTPGMLTGATERSIYTLRSDGDGGIVIQTDYSSQGATLFVNPQDLSRMKLDPQASRFSARYEVTVDKEGVVKVTLPLTFEVNVVPSGWQADFPMPATLAECLVPGPARDALREMALANSRLENFDYLEAYAAFDANPTPAGAQALRERFLVAEQPGRLNLPSSQYAMVEQKFAANPGLVGATPEELRALFTGIDVTARSHAEKNEFADLIKKYSYSGS